MKENKNIDELLRNKLQNFEQEPPGYVLQNILNGTAIKTKRRKVVFYRVSAVAAVLLIALSCLLHLWPDGNMYRTMHRFQSRNSSLHKVFQKNQNMKKLLRLRLPIFTLPENKLKVGKNHRKYFQGSESRKKISWIRMRHQLHQAIEYVTSCIKR